VIGRDTPTRPGFGGVKYKPTWQQTNKCDLLGFLLENCNGLLKVCKIDKYTQPTRKSNWGMPAVFKKVSPYSMGTWPCRLRLAPLAPLPLRKGPLRSAPQRMFTRKPVFDP